MVEIKLETLETSEEAEELIQQELTLFDKDVSDCNIGITKRAQIVQASISYYLHEGTITQEMYFEYHSQLLYGIRKAMKSCICSKK